ncbi:endonuclease/exonuclease/phosphatase family protein [Ostreiculturibacter nitratireducens]|uniref:endonuclease/exonuclease/phosphatase family protein n=1 Tax=Ostreiculturibacter nitratireducens TaxID=3075226 RepID=UPI0031B5E647
MGLRLASYNVHKCVGTDRKRDPGRIVDVLNSVSADVMALQEVDRRMPPRPAALPREMIERDTDYAALPFGLTEESLGWHGQTLLTRTGTEALAIKRIELPGLEPRGAIMAELALPDGRELRVVGVHLGLIRRYRLMQLSAIRAALSRRRDLPTVIIGDFNEWSTHGGVDPIADTFRIHAPGHSFHANRPVAALDRVALGRGLHLRDAGVVDIPLARIASDHLPIWADVRLDTPVPAD